MSDFGGMYDEDNEISDKPPVVVSNGRTKKIRVGAITTEVPSVEYVAELEMMVRNQANQIETLTRSITRLQNLVSNADRSARNNASEINGIWRNLDKKIERKF